MRGGRVGLGQVGHGQVHPGTAARPARARGQRRHPLRGPEPPPGRRGGDARHPGRAHLHDLPGADGGPEPADEGGCADRRDLPRAHGHQRTGSAPARDRAVLRRPPPRSRAHPGQLSPRAVGRAAPAGDDRHGARAGACPHHRRRAHHRARRDHPGPDPRPAQGAAGQARHRGDVHHPRLRGGGRGRGPGGGDARRQARRVRRDRGRAARPAGGLHEGAGGGGAQPAPPARIAPGRVGAGAGAEGAEQGLRRARGPVRRTRPPGPCGTGRRSGGAPRALRRPRRRVGLREVHPRALRGGPGEGRTAATSSSTARTSPDSPASSSSRTGTWYRWCSRTPSHR